jgi:amino acid adenylation domain-containing protein
MKNIKKSHQFSEDKQKLLAYLLAEEEIDLARKPSISRRDNLEESPLSFAQEGLWFLDQFIPQNPAYNIPIALRIKGQLNNTVLEQSLDEILQRHQTLRTKFIFREGQPPQTTFPEFNLAIDCVNIEQISEERRNSHLMQLAVEESQQPFDLRQDVLVRAKLLRLSTEEHVFLLTMHHIVCDGWSLGVLVSELATLYEAFSKGQPSPLPELPIQYADFVVWQRQHLQGDVLETQLDYWKQKLGGSLPVLDLSTDRPRPAKQTMRGAKRSLFLPKTLIKDLKVLSQQQGVTLFITLLTVYKVLLYRYTGQEDILVGTPVANRNQIETENLIGYFVNTLVLRSDISGNPSFRDCLSRVRSVVLEAYNHQEVPFEKLVESLKPDRDLSYSPLFQVMFALQNTPMPSLEFSGLTLSPLAVDNSTAKFDLSFDLSETPNGIDGCIEYNTDLFDAVTIERMSTHFQVLLKSIIEKPDRSVSLLPLVSEAERHQVLVEWNDTQTEYPQDKCVHSLFEEQVEKTPDAVAVVFEEQQLTYRELNQRANQLARYLQGMGVKPEVLVGICVERSIEMIVGLLGILKAGGAYVPLDPSYPTERLADMLSDSQPLVFLTQQRLVEYVPEHQALVVCLDSDWQAIANEDNKNIVSEVKVDNLAYVIYTSGSTGKPKGVTVAHKNLLNLVFWHQHAFEVNSSDRATQLARIAFDASVWEIWPYLAVGASLYLVETELLSSPLKLQNWLGSKQITLSFMPTPLAEELFALEWSENFALRIMLVGGDRLHQFSLASLPFKVINNYGPTENSVVTTSGQVVDFGENVDLPSIGRPISNTQVYILDSDLQPVPIGVPGELHIGGAGLARGYLNRPELTAEKFISNSFTRGERLYKTGDKARYLSDGNIEFLGRLDYQVKIRGFRIELGEIESVLGSHPEIRETVVIAREDVAGEKRLVAYVVVNRDIENLSHQLQNYLRQKLPDYMMPSAFVALEALPLTPNGKIDLRALPAPDRKSLREREYIAPSTPTEEIIVNIFAELLKNGKIGIYDNFFEMGGHSLLATQLISRLRQAFEVELLISKVFELPTVALLESEIKRLRNSQPELKIPPIEPAVGETEAVHLSWSQERLWFLAQLEEATATYNIPGAIRLSGHLNVEALQFALSEIVRRHEILRTSFVSVEGTPVQVINPEATLSFKVVDLQNYEATEREALVQQETKSEAITPFDLKIAPLIRCSLLQLETTESVLLLTMHHIISDGWSIGILLQELSTLYSAYIQGEVSPLAELEIQYADFAMWQRQWLNESVLEEQLDYWKQQLAKLPELLQLPTDRPRPAIQTYRGQTQNFILDTELTQKLHDLSGKSGTTMFMILQAALATLLSRYSGQSDFTIGSPIGNRNRREIEPLIGFFVNTLVLRTKFEDNPSFEELLARVRETTLQAYEHQDVPFEKVVEALKPERSLSHSPLFQVMFSLENTPMGELELSDMTLNFLEVESVTAKFDLTLSMKETSSGLMGTWEYNTDLFDDSTIERMAGHFPNLLEAIVENPQQRVEELPLLTDREQHQLLVEWNNTQTEYPQDKCIHELFEEQVEKTPNAVAVVFEEQQLTYRELNHRANQLARYLQEKGVKPEVLVGICVERSIEMVVGLLGILKAGGAYVPLDPSYPTERLEFMLQDAQVPVLLTQQCLVDFLPEHQAQMVCLDSHWETIAIQSQENVASEVAVDNLAYVIYTSGSTGQPKGVCVAHKGLCNMTQTQKILFDVESTSHVLQFASISFDASVWEIFMAIVNGAMLVLGTAELLMFGSYFKQTTIRHSVTHLTLPPSALNVLVADDLQNIGQIIVAGESCSIDLVSKWSVGRLFCNAYGPTESTVCATVAELREGGERITIGRPIANTQIYILDPHLQPVPVGVPGELHIGGAGLARGYLNRPELTAEKFIPNSFIEGERLYKTGDKARYLSDGNIEFLGRIDHQVKIRGFRIELGEIESVLGSHPKIREIVVIASEDGTGEKRLVAYVVVNWNVENLSNQLREFLKEKLPGYMVPSAFITLEALPLTPNGKIDCRALPAPDLLSRQLETAFVSPRTPTEALLSGIWIEVLGIEQVGVNDNFFELGGHSLLATKVVSRVRETFSVELPLRSLFFSPTVADSAQLIETLLWVSQESEEDFDGSETNREVFQL